MASVLELRPSAWRSAPTPVCDGMTLSKARYSPISSGSLIISVRVVTLPWIVSLITQPNRSATEFR